MLLGLFEAHLDVIDLERSVAFYESVLGLEVVARGEADGSRADAHSRTARRFALLWVGGRGNAMLGLWERRSVDVPPQHIAFEVHVAELSSLVTVLGARGIAFRDFFQRTSGDPTVFGFIPAASVYFDDPDGHVLELLARLDGPPRPELGIITWTEWAQRIQAP